MNLSINNINDNISIKTANNYHLILRFRISSKKRKKQGNRYLLYNRGQFQNFHLLLVQWNSVKAGSEKSIIKRSSSATVSNSKLHSLDIQTIYNRDFDVSLKPTYNFQKRFFQSFKDIQRCSSSSKFVIFDSKEEN